MIEQVRTAYRYFLIMGIGAILFMLSIMVPVLSSSADFSIYNTDWNGCSDLGKDVYSTGAFLPTVDISDSSEERVVHNSFNELEGELPPGRSAIIIIGPDIDFTSEESGFIHDYLSRGGILLLADDVGTGNTLLSGLNTTSRIDGNIMIDLSYMKKGEFAVTSDMKEHEITRNVSTLLLNHPSIVRPSKRSEPIVNSSGTSWLDEQRNERLDPEETEGPFPILTIEKYGLGQLLLLSEPSLLINQMKEQMDNGIFVNNLIEYITKGRDAIVIDESHRDLTNPVQVANIVVTGTSPGEKVGLMVLVTAIFILWSSPIPKRAMHIASKGMERFLSGNTRPEERKDPIDEVIERHPDWDRRLLERIVKGIGES